MPFRPANERSLVRLHPMTFFTILSRNEAFYFQAAKQFLQFYQGTKPKVWHNGGSRIMSGIALPPDQKSRLVPGLSEKFPLLLSLDNFRQKSWIHHSVRVKVSFLENSKDVTGWSRTSDLVRRPKGHALSMN